MDDADSMMEEIKKREKERRKKEGTQRKKMNAKERTYSTVIIT
jgi:hypothetical protein